MAATWRSLPTAKFWNSKLQREIVCSPLLCDFGRLIEANEQCILGLDVKDLLFTTVALYGKNLSEMTSESLLSVLTKKSVKTLIILEKYFNDKTAPLSCQSRRTAINDRECFKPETDKSNCATEIDVVTEEVGEFDDIFSDCSDNSDSSSGESDDEIDLSQEFKDFVEKIRRKKAQNETDSNSCIEKFIIGAVTYDRSYRVPNETTLHVHLLAVRKKFRKCRIGTWLIEKMKDPELVGSFDALVTYADPDAVNFFANNEFSDDLVLNTRYRKIDDNWLNSTPMCYIPHFASGPSMLRSNDAKDTVTTADIKELEKKIKEWRMQQTSCYQSQMICVTALTKQLKIMQKTIESQKNVIEILKNENVKLRTKIKQNGNGDAFPFGEETEESRIVCEFVQQLMVEKNVLNVEVTRIEKASIGRERFYSRLESLKDPLMFTELYYCGGLSKKVLEDLMENGFSDQDFAAGCFGKGLYFSQCPRKAIEFSTPGFLLVCLVGLGNTSSLIKEDPLRTKPPEGCDSVLTIGRPLFGNQYITGQEYVIYDKNQAVPIYLINFEVEWTTNTNY